VSTPVAGRVVLVTGAGAGLGRAYAHLLARQGCRVVVNDLGTSPDGEGASVAAAETAVAEIRAAGGEAVADTHSAADPDGAAAMVARAVDTYGRLDAVVNNAGIVRYGGFHRQGHDDVAAVLDVHVGGSILVTRAAWAELARHGAGRVVFTSSSIGLLGTPGQAAYAVAKTAVVGLTRSLAYEGASLGIAVNAVAPMATTRLNEDVMVEMFGANAVALTPEKVAPVVAYLVAPDCRLSGEVLSVAGGRVARFALGLGPPVPVAADPGDGPYEWWAPPP